MKQKLHQIVAITGLMMVSLFMSLGAFAQTGIIKGRVLDKGQNQPLPGATVIIDDSNRGTVTDINGFYTLLNVVAGKHTITVSYIGYESKTAEVVVNGNETSTLNIVMEDGIMMGEGVIISADRIEGQARALNRQKNNINVTNMISSDQVGKFPDSNIGDAMKRIPGITMQYDQGEARFGVVRGTDPSLNSVTVNGERVPSAEDGTRAVQLDLIPADMIQAVEVSKTLTPDMDADAIGGSTNLITRAAPGGMRISATGAMGYNTLRNKPTYQGALVFGNRYLDNKLGVVLSGSYQLNQLGSDNVEFEWTEDEGQIWAEEQQIRTYELTRERRSISAALDYQLNPNHNFFFNAMYNHRNDWENRYRLTYKDITKPENGISEEEGENKIKIQTKGGIDNDKNKNTRLEDQRTQLYSFGGKHLIASKLEMNWSVAWAKAQEHRPNERYITYESESNKFRSSDLNTQKPLVSMINGLDYGNFELDEISEEEKLTYEIDRNARLDLKLPTGNSGNIKFGGRIRTKYKMNEQMYTAYSPVGDNEANFETMDKLPLKDMTKSDYLAGGKYQAGHYVDREFLGKLDLNNPNLFEGEAVLEEFAPSNFNATEDIYAGYLMTEQTLGDKLGLIAGFRMEHTSTKYNANQYLVTYREFQEVDDQGNLVFENGEPVMDDESEEIITPVSGSNSYNSFLPALHFKYSVNKNTILRFAWTNSIARPNYEDLTPSLSIIQEDEEIEKGNPALENMKSMNFDLMFERYFENVGIISGGLFYKDIKDYFYTNVYEETNGNYEGYEVKQTVNGDKASLYGVEIAVQRQLDFLPGVLSGLGVYANYTYTKSEAKGMDSRPDETLSLPRTAEHSGNVSLSYDLKKLTMRLSWNYTSDYLDEVGDDNFNDRYYDIQSFLDLNATYAFNNNWRVFFEANNLTNQPLRYYQGAVDRTMQTEYYGPRFNLGVKYDLFR
ncbi:TonB-dependent receptor [Aureibacter tunicatorum]|uniref:TonB-dependent receptor n=1 Tax=Aureibacter tunicatorum TaxID=866807 RepID=A0AAE3XTY4_9BACT|nr:TonB-dependent receptor [Aureibacter tunicatorum]MDR6241639.1 TonB-dependent receptor [Aureibacter tunicatorum]BDD07245.1 TonB-dependent receptor [Aureibacter tunicatorum]